jgi:hypothetical protein
VFWAAAGATQTNTGGVIAGNLFVNYGSISPSSTLAIDIRSCDGIKIYNNTFVSGTMGRYAVQITRDTATPPPDIGDFDIRRNIMVYNGAESTGYLVNLGGSNGLVWASGMNIDENCYFRATAGNPYFQWEGVSKTSFAAYQSAAGAEATPQEQNSIYADPQFVNMAAGDYRLAAGSPCKGFGAGDVGYRAACLASPSAGELYVTAMPDEALADAGAIQEDHFA